MIQGLPEHLATSVSSTLQHIQLLRAKEARLAAASREALAQVIHRIGSAHRAGEITDAQLCAAFDGVKQTGMPGRMLLWDEHVDIRWKQVIQLKRRLPNGPEGSWVGEYPIADGAASPMPGTAVVYVLFDRNNQPCYVGSTEKFRARMASHGRTKDFVRWQAHPCDDRDHAYRLEDRLLRLHKPYLNVKASR